MALERGFLRIPNHQFDRQRVVTAVLLVLISSVILYYFLIYFKELFRLFTFSFRGYLLILSGLENFFYNWFYANMALNLSLGIGIKFLFENAYRKKQPHDETFKPLSSQIKHFTPGITPIGLQRYFQPSEYLPWAGYLYTQVLITLTTTGTSLYYWWLFGISTFG